MVTKCYGFKEKPFDITPDPRFLFLSDHQKEALAHLTYA
jgi:general secretion pathway protein A